MRRLGLPALVLAATLFLAASAGVAPARADQTPPAPAKPAAKPAKAQPQGQLYRDVMRGRAEEERTVIGPNGIRLTPSEAALLKRFDVKGDGLDQDELAAAHEELLNEKDAADGTGRAPAGGSRAAAARLIYSRMLAMFDHDNAGRLDPAEQAEAVDFLRENRPYVYQRLVRRFDANHDGQLDAGERAAMFQALAGMSAGTAPTPAH